MRVGLGRTLSFRIPILLWPAVVGFMGVWGGRLKDLHRRSPRLWWGDGWRPGIPSLIFLPVCSLMRVLSRAM